MKYLVRVSQLRYGTVVVEAENEKNAKKIAARRVVDFFDEEITDMTAEELKEGQEVEKVHEVKAELHFRVTQQDIDDIMVSVLEGGINYWCRKAEVVGGKYLGEYASDQISRGGSLMLYDIESSDKWELTLEKFLAGLKMYVENGGAGCVWDEAIDTGEIDGCAADNIVQYALFGELVFG